MERVLEKVHTLHTTAGKDARAPLVHMRHQAGAANYFHQLVAARGPLHTDQIIFARQIFKALYRFAQYLPFFRIRFLYLHTFLVNDAAAIDLSFIYDPQKRFIFRRQFFLKGERVSAAAAAQYQGVSGSAISVRPAEDVKESGFLTTYSPLHTGHLGRADRARLKSFAALGRIAAAIAVAASAAGKPFVGKLDGRGFPAAYQRHVPGISDHSGQRPFT